MAMTPADKVTNGFHRATQDVAMVQGLIHKASTARDAEQMEGALLDALAMIDQLEAGLRRIIHNIM